MTTTLTPQSGEPMDRRTEVHVVSRVSRGCRIGLNVWPVPTWKNTCHESSNRRYPDVLPFCSRKTCFWTHFFWKKMIPSGYVKHSYWKWPSRNSGVFPLKNGGSFHSFLIFLLTFTRGSSPHIMHWVLGIPKLEMSSQFFPYLYIDEDWVHPCPVPPRPWIHRPLVFCGEKPWKMPIPFNKATFFFSSGIQKWRVLLSIIIPSGKRSHNYGKIHHFSMGKLHYFYGHFQ